MVKFEHRKQACIELEGLFLGRLPSFGYSGKNFVNTIITILRITVPLFGVHRRCENLGTVEGHCEPQFFDGDGQSTQEHATRPSMSTTITLLPEKSHQKKRLCAPN